MMIDINKIVEVIENFAPLESAEVWDNSGWQINLGIREAKKILLALSLTPKILKQAIEQECDFVITHHPLIFSPFKKIEYETVTQKLMVECIKNNIQVYCAHTNLDVASGGLNDTLAEKLGLVPNLTVDNFVKIAQYSEALSLDDFILKLKIALNCQKLKVINPANIQQIRTVAMCSGSGGDFIPKLKDIDLFVTGDVKYHSALDVENMVVIDAGHFETEKIILQTLKNLLQPYAQDIVIAKETEPWVFV